MNAGATDSSGTPDQPGLDLGAVVEAVVYAPLGLVLEGRSLLPKLVERGRNQVAMARIMGEFAVRKGAEDLAAGAVDAQERVLGLLGWGAGSPSPPPAAGSDRPGGSGGAAAPPPTAARVAPEDAAAAAEIDPASLPIPDYDLLSASQVVPRLESLDADELALVGRYEAGTRGRRTILAKVDQLRGGTAP